MNSIHWSKLNHIRCYYFETNRASVKSHRSFLKEDTFHYCLKLFKKLWVICTVFKISSKIKFRMEISDQIVTFKLKFLRPSLSELGLVSLDLIVRSRSFIWLLIYQIWFKIELIMVEILTMYAIKWDTKNLNNIPVLMRNSSGDNSTQQSK